MLTQPLYAALPSQSRDPSLSDADYAAMNGISNDAPSAWTTLETGNRLANEPDAVVVLPRNSMSKWLSKLGMRWQGETDGAGLALIRILVAFSVFREMLDIILRGRITELLVEPDLHFKYALFSWIGPPQGLMPQVFVWSLMTVAVFVIVGWRTRWTAALMALGYVYWFLIDVASYSDHSYLVCLLSILIAWLPTNRWASVDAYTGREHRTLVPSWSVELVRVQLAFVYLFFGLSLLNSDWLNGAPLIAWAETAEGNPATKLLAGREGMLLLIARSLPALYITFAVLLWWKRTRMVAFSGLALIHLCDQFAFRVTVSPWLLPGASLIYCESTSWRPWGAAATQWLCRWPACRMIWTGLCRSGMILDRCVSWFDETPLVRSTQPAAHELPRVRRQGRTSWIPADTPRAVNRSSGSNAHQVLTPESFPGMARWAVTVWIAIQCWMPFRYLTLESNPDWSDLATTFAWRGQHRDKQCELRLSVIQPSQQLRWPLDPIDEFPVPQAMFHTDSRLEALGLSEGALKDLITGADQTRAERLSAVGLTQAEIDRIFSNYQATVQLRLVPWQYHQMIQRPELIRQYAHRIGAALSRILDEEVQVHAELLVKLNNRPTQVLLSGREDVNLREIRSVHELAGKLEPLTTVLPSHVEQISIAKESAIQRKQDLDHEMDSSLVKNRRTEPVKLPPLSDADERWFQEKYVRN